MSESEKVLAEMYNLWAENWDVFVDFHGQEMADKVEAAVLNQDTYGALEMD